MKYTFRWKRALQDQILQHQYFSKAHLQLEIMKNANPTLRIFQLFNHYNQYLTDNLK